MVLTDGIPPAFRDGVLFIPSIAIGSVPSVSGHATSYRWHRPPKVRRRRASSPQGSLCNRCCLFQVTFVDQFLCASLFPRPFLVQNSGHVRCSPRSIGARGNEKKIGERCGHKIRAVNLSYSFFCLFFSISPRTLALRARTCHGSVFGFIELLCCYVGARNDVSRARGRRRLGDFSVLTSDNVSLTTDYECIVVRWPLLPCRRFALG